jgi:hypothetical protein
VPPPCQPPYAVVVERRPAACGEPIEQDDADGQAELLAGDAVRDRFENRREARRLQAEKGIGELTQPGIALRQSIKRPQVDASPEGAFEGSSGGCLRLHRQPFAARGHTQRRAFGGPI